MAKVQFTVSLETDDYDASISSSEMEGMIKNVARDALGEFFNSRSPAREYVAKYSPNMDGVERAVAMRAVSVRNLLALDLARAVEIARFETPNMEECLACDGTGVQQERASCTRCNGNGEVEVPTCLT